MDPIEIKVTPPAPHSKKQALIYGAFQIPTLRKLYVACGTKFGKACALDTPVPTLGGWRFMGEIEPGDFVFDENGKPTKVLSVTDPMFERECFEVVFSDGSNLVVDGQHEWITETHASRKNRARSLKTNSKPEKLTTLEIRDSLRATVGGRERPNHSVDLVGGPLKFHPKDFAIPPYTLGVWLGDGSRWGGQITNPDEEVRNGVQEDGLFQVGEANGILYNIHGLLPVLRREGLLCNKHVPSKYLEGSPRQRLSLLQGLMDTDGTISKRGDCTFDNSNENLADAVQVVAQSLGIKCTRSVRQGRLYGVDKRLSYRVHFTTDLEVFRVERKKKRLRKVSSKSRRRYIVEVNPVPSVPVKCLTVESPSHLFLVTKSCIPTHNSLSASACESQAALTRPGTLWRWIAPIYDQAKIGMSYFKKMLPPPPHSEFKEGAMLAKLPRIETEIQFWHCKNPTSLEGVGSHGNIFDEAAKCPYEAVVSAQTTVTFTKGPQAYFSTPLGKNWFYRECMEAKEHMEWALRKGKDPERVFIQARTVDNPYIDPKVVEEAKRALPDRLFRQYYLAEFVEDGMVFVGFRDCIHGPELSDIYGATQYWFGDEAKDSDVFIGVDWAKKEDYTVFTAIRLVEGHPRVIGFMRFQGIGYVQALKELYKFANKFKSVILIKHDRTGVGEAIDDMLAQMPYSFEGVIFTNASKAAMVNQLIMAFETREIAIPHWPELIKELESYSVIVNELGTARYNAPSGMHDDIVSSLMLANYAAQEYGAEFKLQFIEDLPKKKLSVDQWYNDLMSDLD